MRILVLGAGKMGSFFLDLLSFDHEMAVYDKDPKRMRFTYNCQRLSSLEEIGVFNPELVINAVTVKYTIAAFKEVMPYIGNDCIISDISSVKTGLKDYYATTGHRYVSTHPMFGPTFANLNQLSEENAIIISEGDYMGRIFFKDMYSRLGLNIYEYTFDEHDRTVAYSLSIPFVSEDDYLLQEILFNPYTSEQVASIRDEMTKLLEIIDHKDADAMKQYLTRIRNNVRKDIEIKQGK